MAQIITNLVSYPIQPKDINASTHFFDAFGNNEMEVSAHYVVLLCQESGGWKPFTLGEINAFYRNRGHHDGFWFNGLDDGRFIVLQDGKYHVTHDFIGRCFTASPA